MFKKTENRWNEVLDFENLGRPTYEMNAWKSYKKIR